MLETATISEIATDTPSVFAFRIRGTVRADDLRRMAERMNAAFDRHDTAHMLLIFDGYEGQETGAGFDWETLKAQFRSLGKVGKYAVVGAPDGARKMIETMDAINPVDAKTFDREDEAAAWRFVGSRPAGTR